MHHCMLLNSSQRSPHDNFSNDATVCKFKNTLGNNLENMVQATSQAVAATARAAKGWAATACRRQQVSKQEPAGQQKV